MPITWSGVVMATHHASRHHGDTRLSVTMLTPGARSPWQRVPPGYLDDAVRVDAEVEVSEDEEGYVAMFVGVEPVQSVLQRPPTVLAVWRRTLRTEAQGLPENRRRRITY